MSGNEGEADPEVREVGELAAAERSKLAGGASKVPRSDLRWVLALAALLAVGAVIWLAAR